MALPKMTERLLVGDFRTNDFDFELPAHHIAQFPADPKEAARLLHVAGSRLSDCHVYDLPSLLRAGDVLVVNNTKVIPARLYGLRGGVKVEILLHRNTKDKLWLAFAKPGKRLRVGDHILIGADFEASVIEKYANGQVLLEFSAGKEAIMPFLLKYGEPPLPPYIKREKDEARKDVERYQTPFAQHEGAVAAPTAGLHFTSNLLQKLADQNIQIAEVTLHVGAGTFLPVKADKIRDHVMHAEWGEVRPEIAALLNKARTEGRRLVAVGTTSLRLLETAATDDGLLKSFSGETDIFITPGYKFRSVDVLMTNFHLPKSTLFMLVCAFAGIDTMRKAYAHAIDKDYRFYSYGDATLLERA